ncbi:hypothetical protein J5X84_30830 [Streptosporangiaceae bacterium NEAU-GS5]|nr:hypothetical protein [Streptosporangiaceae bacterium NEAU-GS5]
MNITSWTLRMAERLLAHACRRLPIETAEERYLEWSAELPAILEDPEVRPRLRRIFRVLAFALDQSRGARALRSLPAQPHSLVFTAQHGGFLSRRISSICLYGESALPALLQTRDYAEALADTVTLPSLVPARIAHWRERQKVLHGRRGPVIWAIIDEISLRRPVGGREVMRGQIEHLIELSRRPNIRIQLLPFSYSGGPVPGGSFSVLGIDDKDSSEVIHIERISHSIYINEDVQVDRYTETFDRLSTASQSPEEFTELLRKLLRVLSNDVPVR